MGASSLTWSAKASGVNGYSRGLDTLRAGAILLVMLYHLQSDLSPMFGRVAHFAWMGVDLFFVLSGYLIGMQLLKVGGPGTAMGVWRFYVRRAFRILPAYFVVLSLYVLVPVWREHPGLSPVWEFVTFTENLFVDYGKNAAFSHVWSLCIEEQFYFIFPWVVLVMLRWPSAKRTFSLLIFLTLVGVAFRSFNFLHVLRPLGPEDAGIAYIERIYYPTLARMDGLVAGVGLALVRIFRPRWWELFARRGHMLLGVGVALLSLSMWLFNDRFTSQTGAAEWGTLVGFPMMSYAFAFIVASSLSDNGLLRRAQVPGAQLISALAFSLYLTHKALTHLASVWLPSLIEDRPWTTLLVYTMTSFAGAALLYFGVERPFLKLRARIEGRASGARSIAEARLDPAL